MEIDCLSRVPRISYDSATVLRRPTRAGPVL